MEKIIETKMVEDFPTTKEERFKNTFIRQQKLKMLEEQRPMKIGSNYFKDD